MLRRFPSCNAASLVLIFIFVVVAFYRARNYNRLVINAKTVGLGSGGESEGFLIFSVLQGWGEVVDFRYSGNFFKKKLISLCATLPPKINY